MMRGRRKGFVIAITPLPRCIPLLWNRVHADTPVGRVLLGSKNPNGLTGFDVNRTLRTTTAQVAVGGKAAILTAA